MPRSMNGRRQEKPAGWNLSLKKENYDMASSVVISLPANRATVPWLGRLPFCRGSGLPDRTAGKTAPDLIHFPCIKSGQTSQRYLDNHRFRPFRTFRFTGIPAGSNKRYRDRITPLANHRQPAKHLKVRHTKFLPANPVTGHFLQNRQRLFPPIIFHVLLPELKRHACLTTVHTTCSVNFSVRQNTDRSTFPS